MAALHKHSIMRQIDIILCRFHQSQMYSHRRFTVKLLKQNFRLCVKSHFHSSHVSKTMIINPRGPGSKYCTPPRDELIEAHMHNLFGDNKSFSTEEWDRFRDTLCFQYMSLNESNFDSVTMKALATKNNYSLAASFMKYLKEIGIKPNMVTYMKYMQLCGRNSNQCEQEEILRMYTKIKNIIEAKPVLDTTTVDCIVQGLCATDQWETAFDILNKLPEGFKAAGTTKDAIACAALRNNDEPLGWDVITNWYAPTDTCYPRAYEEYVRFACRTYKQDPNAADFYITKLLNHFRMKNIVVKHSTVKGIFTYFYNHKIKWNLKYTKVNEEGKCFACNQDLQEIRLSKEEFNLLKKSFLQRSLHKSNVFINSTEKEFQRFCAFIKDCGPFDVVLDGLNIAYVSHKHAYKEGLAEKLLEVVKKLSPTSSRILVIGRSHMRKWPKYIMGKVMRLSKVFYTANSSEDDPFLVYATLASGPECKFVSSDLMRDHISRLDSPQLIQLFEHWRQSHQIYVFYDDKGLQLVGPLKHSVSIQGCMRGGWHIPYDDEFILEPYEELNNWLCIQQTT